MEVFDSILKDQHMGYILLRITAILFLTFVTGKLYNKLFRLVVKKHRIHVKFINNIITIMIYVVGSFIALNEIPSVENGFQALLAGSGIAALTIGLAAQESLGNAINGMFISMFRPFEVGDRVHLINGNITGYIEDITLRHTVVRTFVNSRVIIPNSVINKELIENSDYWDGKASSFVDVMITYDSDLELAKRLMSHVVSKHEDFVDTRPPELRTGSAAPVYIRALSMYGVELRVSMWTDNIGNNFGACSDARERIKAEFDKHGIHIAHSNAFDPHKSKLM